MNSMNFADNSVPKLLRAKQFEIAPKKPHRDTLCEGVSGAKFSHFIVYVYSRPIMCSASVIQYSASVIHVQYISYVCIVHQLSEHDQSEYLSIWYPAILDIVMRHVCYVTSGVFYINLNHFTF